MKFSLLTLGALAFSAQQASTVRGENEGNAQDTQKDVCSADKSLSFNITQAGQSVIFTCGTDVPTLDPAFNPTTPEMYEGGNKVKILEFLPNATLQEVAKDPSTQNLVRGDESVKTYNFTVPNLPSDEHHLYVNCTKTAAQTVRTDSETKTCKVSFYIASSAVRAGLAMSAVVGVIASLLQFA
ncbi:SAG-related sequence protein SRS22I [Toxoplasma gondii COUG]|uniref:SAG-related sequence protein SRS22I n=1 Tax=Toxoplasma gondii COUG TaxID=1074873 RepID=A0A2G8XLM9_TOXGO|nr:SAG-related sequence protein SRS22I [Toxoplasma gondii COUG]